MSKQFTPCPACGAVGEIDKRCLFCGTIIVSKEGSVISDARIVRQRTISAQQYAEKISIYHNVKSLGDGLTMVSIGKMYGLINLNGDIIYPLGNDKIRLVSKDTIGLGHTYEETLSDATTYWNGYEWKHQEACTHTEFIPTSYWNLNTGMHADKLGFIEDKENSGKLYRVDVYNGWKPMNTYTNLDGEVHSYDYAEQILLSNSDKDVYRRRKLYLLHHGNECSLWILYNVFIDSDYFESIGISRNDEKKALEANPTFPMCVLEGIQDKYTIEANNIIIQIVVRTSSGIDVPLTLATKKYGDTGWNSNDFDKIYNEWCKAIGKQIPETGSEEWEEDNDYVEQEVQDDDGTILGHSKIEWIICIIGIILYTLYRVYF